MIRWKKTAATLLAGCMTLSLAACGSNGDQTLPDTGDDAAAGEVAMGRYIETPVEADLDGAHQILGMQTGTAGTVSF